MSATTAICKLVKAGHSARRLLDYLSHREGEVCGDMRNDGIVTGDARLDAMNLTLEHDGRRASEVRHIIISCPEKSLLKPLCHDWIVAYAPNRKFLIKIHADGEHPAFLLERAKSRSGFCAFSR